MEAKAELRSKLAVQIDELSRQIEDNRYTRIIVLTGAGISTAAGIPDFRSPGTGLYSTLHQRYPDIIGKSDDGGGGVGTANGDGKSLERALSIEFFKEDRGKLFALIKKDFLTKVGAVKPTKAHDFVRRLQDRGCLLRHYTQNTDGLEKVAGISNEKLVQCHGNTDQAYCIDCGIECDAAEWKKRTMETGLPVSCNVCESGVIKPSIVLYGEPLSSRYNELVTDRISAKQTTDFDECDLLIVMGTSLNVPPFNMLPELVDDDCVRVLINLEKIEERSLPPGFDGFDFEGPRDIFLQGNCEEICGCILDRISG